MNNAIISFAAYCAFGAIILTISIRPLMRLTNKIFVYHKNENTTEKILLFTTYSLISVVIGIIILLYYASIVSIVEPEITIAQIAGIAVFFALLTSIARISAFAYKQSSDSNSNPREKKRTIQNTYYSFLLVLVFLGLLGNAALFVTPGAEVNIDITGSLDSSFFILFTGVVSSVFILSAFTELLLSATKSPFEVPSVLQTKK